MKEPLKCKKCGQDKFDYYCDDWNRDKHEYECSKCGELHYVIGDTKTEGGLVYLLAGSKVKK
jgi:hypothetical protein